MEIDAPWLLALYGLGIAASSLLGGWIPDRIAISHTRIQAVMAFVAGLIAGVAIFHLLPHSVAALSGPGAVETAVGWMMTGIVLSVLLFYLFDYHEHDFSEEHSHQHDHRHDRNSRAAHRMKSVTWIGIALGLGVHSLTEGLTLSTTMRLTHDGDVSAAGLGVFLAIALHKPLDALSIVSTMQANGASRRARVAANLGFALVCPVAAFVTFWGVGQIGPAATTLIGCALAFAAGSFLCIALSDLLPEIHFHRHDRILLALAFLLGIGIAYSLHWVEPDVLHGVSEPH